MLKTMSKQKQADLSMLLVAFIWGTTFVLTKNALVDIGPFLFLGIRFLLAFLVLAVVSLKSITKITFSTVSTGCLLGLFLFIGYVFQTVGLQYTSSSNAGFITGLSVVLVPVIYSILNKTMPSFSTICTIILATTGLYLLSVKAGSFKLSYGDLLVLICAFAFAMHIILVDRFSHKHNPIAITSVQILFVGIICMIIGLYIEPWPEHITSNAASAIFITAVFATALAFIIQNALQKYSTPIRFALVLAMEPVFAGIAGYLWAGELLSHRALAGAALILLAMLISIVLQNQEKKTKS